MKNKKPKGMTLVQYVAEYGLCCDITPESLRQSTAAVIALEKWLGRSVGASELADDLVNEWIAAMTSNGLAKATARSYRARVLALWRASHRAGYCESPPGQIRSVRLPFRAPEAWRVDDVRTILATAESLRVPFRRITLKRHEFWSLAIRLAWDTALRFRDLTRLKKTDFDKDGIAVVTQHKTGRWHTIRIHESTHEMVRRFAPTDDLALPWPLSEGNFQKQFVGIVAKAGLRGPWKKIRKSSATDVESRYPGAGAAHLGHVAGSIAHTNYLDPRLLAFNRPMSTEIAAANIAKEVTGDLDLMQYVAIYLDGYEVTRPTELLYENAVIHLSQWAGGPVRCRKLSVGMVAQFLHDIARAGDISRQTIGRRRMCLTNLFNAIEAELQNQPPPEAPGGIS